MQSSRRCEHGRTSQLPRQGSRCSRDGSRVSLVLMRRDRRPARAGVREQRFPQSILSQRNACPQQTISVVPAPLGRLQRSCEEWFRPQKDRACSIWSRTNRSHSFATARRTSRGIARDRAVAAENLSTAVIDVECIDAEGTNRKVPRLTAARRPGDHDHARARHGASAGLERCVRLREHIRGQSARD